MMNFYPTESLGDAVRPFTHDMQMLLLYVGLLNDELTSRTNKFIKRSHREVVFTLLASFLVQKTGEVKFSTPF